MWLTSCRSNECDIRRGTIHRYETISLVIMKDRKRPQILSPSLNRIYATQIRT